MKECIHRRRYSFPHVSVLQVIDCVFPDCPPLTKRVITRIPGVCCPNVSCVNVTTCEVKGITYLLGDKIPHEDPCVNW